jgi:pimeloyl-ACP methyl ester carboxylesterase
MNCELPALRWLDRPGGDRLAYRCREGRVPTVVFLGGFTSDMGGTKAQALDAHAARQGHAFVRFDYQGHGASSGLFRDGTVGRWIDDALAVVDRVARGPTVLVGSSMGAWVAVRAALARPERVAALVGLAAAPDFPWELLEPRLSAQERASLETRGEVSLPSRYGGEPVTLTRSFFEEARRHGVLGERLRVRCPVRLLHGMRDQDVPWQTSVRLAGALESDDVTVTLVKLGDHRLSSPADLERLRAVVDEACRLGRGG